jgi:hypothetical protein
LQQTRALPLSEFISVAQDDAATLMHTTAVGSEIAAVWHQNLSCISETIGATPASSLVGSKNVVVDDRGNHGEEESAFDALLDHDPLDVAEQENRFPLRRRVTMYDSWNSDQPPNQSSSRSSLHIFADGDDANSHHLRGHWKPYPPATSNDRLRHRLDPM